MKTRTFIAARLAANAGTIATTRHPLSRRAWLWTVFLGLASFPFGPRLAQAAVTGAWVQCYNNVASSSTDLAVKVVRDAAGDIIVTGRTTGGLPGADTLTIKCSGTGWVGAAGEEKITARIVRLTVKELGLEAEKAKPAQTPSPNRTQQRRAITSAFGELLTLLREKAVGPFDTAALRSWKGEEISRVQ